MLILRLLLCRLIYRIQFCGYISYWEEGGEIFPPSESRTVKDVTSALARLCLRLQGSGTMLVLIKATSFFFFSSEDVRKKYLSTGRSKSGQAVLRAPKRKLCIKSSATYHEQVLWRIQPRLDPWERMHQDGVYSKSSGCCERETETRQN